tara:strand:+ start:124 stop:921 length:798 start_codon:yes stop_codon:yes gene_type:complete
VYFSYQSKNNLETFEANSKFVLYNKNNTNMVYDNFYISLIDELFFDKEYYQQFCNIILKNISNVYNNHLCIGIKHGGHINELLLNNMNTTTISKIKNIVLYCQYKYPKNVYHYKHDYDSNSYIFDEKSYTMISLIDSDVYCHNDIYGLFYNISRWIIHKGYLYVDVYDTIEYLKKGVRTVNDGNFVEQNYKYNNDIETIDTKMFYLKENIQNGCFEKKKYKKEFIFHSIDKIIYVAQECGFKLENHFKHSTFKYQGRGILVFQKE